MAYLRAGLTSEELAERFHKEAPGLSPQEIVARFGAPRHPEREDLAPYSFLEGDPFSANAIRSYRELRSPDWVDDRKRRYFRFRSDMPKSVYVELPIGETTRERRERVASMHMQDFPKPNDEIVLYRAAKGGRRKRSLDDDDDENQDSREELLRARVVRVEFQRTATAVITLDSELPQERASHPDPDSAQMKKHIQTQVKKLQAAALSRGLPEGELAISFARAPRKDAGEARRSRSAGLSAPRAPRAPK